MQGRLSLRQNACNFKLWLEHAIGLSAQLAVFHCTFSCPRILGRKGHCLMSEMEKQLGELSLKMIKESIVVKNILMQRMTTLYFFGVGVVVLQMLFSIRNFNWQHMFKCMNPWIFIHMLFYIFAYLCYCGGIILENNVSLDSNFWTISGYKNGHSSKS